MSATLTEAFRGLLHPFLQSEGRNRLHTKLTMKGVSHSVSGLSGQIWEEDSFGKEGRFRKDST